MAEVICSYNFFVSDALELMSSVLVTGATGFVGRGLVSRLTSVGLKTSAVFRGRKADFADDRFVTWLPVSGLDDDFSLGNCDVLVHLAARVHVMQERTANSLTEFRRINVDATERLARRAAAAGVRRFIFLSSVKVNGEETVAGKPFRADDEPAPEDAYGISKYEAEMALRRITTETGLEVVIIRPPLVYGPGIRGNFAALIKWVGKEVPPPLGAVHNRRSLVALDNLLCFIELCEDRATTTQAANQVFLVSDGRAVSTTELLHQFALAYGRKPHLVSVPTGLMRFCARILGKATIANRLLESLVLNNAKARKMLGWRPPVSMDEQLLRMFGAASS